jgi:hypothetical protein
VGIVRGTAAALVASVMASVAVAAQQTGKQARDAYFSAVADFFGLPATEVSILAQWQLPPDEIPVVLFIADRAGVSAEALVALRSSGKSWSELARRYHVDASHFYVPLPDAADPGVLKRAYERFRALPVSRWGEVSLSDSDIVALVNVRVLARTLHLTPAEVLRAAPAGRSFVDVFASLMREDDRRLSPTG